MRYIIKLTIFVQKYLDMISGNCLMTLHNCTAIIMRFIQECFLRGRFALIDDFETVKMTISWSVEDTWQIKSYWVYSSASRNSIPSRNFQLRISAPFSSWNFRLEISELKFRAEIFWVEIFSSENELKFRAKIFLSRNFQLGKGAEIWSWNFRVENFHYFH